MKHIRPPKSMLPLILLLLGMAVPLAAYADEPAPSPSPDTVYRLSVRFHLVCDMPMVQKGVPMVDWVTPEQIKGTIMPEVNRIWSAAKIEWALAGVDRVSAGSKHLAAEVIDYVLHSARDDQGHPDLACLKKLLSLLKLDQEDRTVVNVYLLPYLGATSQGVTQPRQKRVVVGQWTDKPSQGKRSPEKCLLLEKGEFQRGSLARTIAHELGHVLGLQHPAKNSPPYHRVMGGTNPGNDLAEGEKATARKTAAVLLSKEEKADHRAN